MRSLCNLHVDKSHSVRSPQAPAPSPISTVACPNVNTTIRQIGGNKAQVNVTKNSILMDNVPTCVKTKAAPNTSLLVYKRQYEHSPFDSDIMIVLNNIFHIDHQEQETPCDSKFSRIWRIHLEGISKPQRG